MVYRKSNTGERITPLQQTVAVTETYLKYDAKY